MGANPYCYFTEFSTDVPRALELLRLAEFKAGRYEPCFLEKTDKYLFEIDFAPRDTFPAPGNCHDSIEEVYEYLDEAGSNSILDILRSTDEPFPPLDGAASPEEMFARMNASAPLAEDDLIDIFGHLKPTRQEISDILLNPGTDGPDDIDIHHKQDIFWSLMDRGQCRHIILYSNEKPDQVFFAGLSFD